MMPYFAYFSANTKTDTEAIQGTCYEMCPEFEVKMREKEKLVHLLEVLGSSRKLVKSYSRSAADSNMARPSVLRPYPVLRNTVEYLLLEVTKRVDVPSQCVYNFVHDRLRAVRQDMTIQRLPSEQVTQLLEPMIRFYVFYGHKLCQLPIKEFDPTLNKKHLLECITWFLSYYKQEDTDNQLSGIFGNLNLKYKLKCDRILVECLYLLSNLNSVQTLYRFLSLPKYIKRDPRLNLAYRIAVANLRGNYIDVCRLMDNLCILTYCAVFLYLPVLQRRALQVMSYAYSSKALSVPAAALRRWLRFSSDADVLSACRHYGLAADGGSVRFGKADFKADVPTLQPQKLLNFEKKLDFSVDNVFCY